MQTLYSTRSLSAAENTWHARASQIHASRGPISLHATHAPLDLLSVARARPSGWCRALRAPPGSFRHGPLDLDPRVRRIIRDYSRGLRASCWGRATTSVGHLFPGGWAAILGNDILCVKSRRLLGCGWRWKMTQRPRIAVVAGRKKHVRLYIFSNRG